MEEMSLHYLGIYPYIGIKDRFDTLRTILIPSEYGKLLCRPDDGVESQRLHVFPALGYPNFRQPQTPSNPSIQFVAISDEQLHELFPARS